MTINCLTNTFKNKFLHLLKLYCQILSYIRLSVLLLKFSPTLKYSANTANRFAQIIQMNRFNRTIRSRIGHQYNKDNLGALSPLNQPAGFSKVQPLCETKHINLSDKPRLSAVVSLNCHFCIAKCHSRRNLGTKEMDNHPIRPFIYTSIHLQNARVSSSLTGWRRE